MGAEESKQNSSNIKRIHNVDIYDVYYKMEPHKQNVALIFNNYSYDSHLGLKDKVNPEEDVPRLTSCLKAIGFNTECHDNLPFYEIQSYLAEVADIPLEMLGCLLVIVLACGTQDSILAADKRYAVEELWKQYVDNELLIGVPKIFVIETFHEEVTNDGSGGQQFVKAPSMTDYIFVNSSYSDASLQLCHNSSRYISALCTVLEDEDNLKKYDLLQILTLANNLVLRSFPHDTSLNKRHVPRIISMMPKLLRLAYPD